MLRLKTLRHYAIARSLFAPTTLQAAIDRLGFVQADPIRAPAGIWSNITRSLPWRKTTSSTTASWHQRIWI